MTTPTPTLLVCLLALAAVAATQGANLTANHVGKDRESPGDGADDATPPENEVTPPRRGSVKFIVGGTEMADGECPWMVSILGDQRKFCGGSVISPQWVLTAAHCVVGVRQFSMVFGSIEMYGGEGDGTVRRVSSFAVPHNRYDRRTNDHDIALIKNATPLVLRGKVRAIRLPSYSQQRTTFEGEPAIVCGWGKTSDTGPSSGHRLLSCVAMPVIPLAVCERQFSGLTNKHVCLDARDARGSCEGDSGGPLVWQELDGRFTQIGLVSYGSKYCEDGAPGVYTRVSGYLGWIGWNTGVRIKH